MKNGVEGGGGFGVAVIPVRSIVLCLVKVVLNINENVWVNVGNLMRFL